MEERIPDESPQQTFLRYSIQPKKVFANNQQQTNDIFDNDFTQNHNHPFKIG